MSRRVGTGVKSRNSQDLMGFESETEDLYQQDQNDSQLQQSQQIPGNGISPDETVQPRHFLRSTTPQISAARAVRISVVEDTRSSGRNSLGSKDQPDSSAPLISVARAQGYGIEHTRVSGGNPLGSNGRDSSAPLISVARAQGYGIEHTRVSGGNPLGSNGRDSSAPLSLWPVPRDMGLSTPE